MSSTSAFALLAGFLFNVVAFRGRFRFVFPSQILGSQSWFGGSG